MFLVIPAAVIALLVLILGSILVVAQQTMTAYGTRAALMLAGDTRAQGSIARALLISVAAVLLAGQLPEHGRPAPSITAGAATLALATAFHPGRRAAADGDPSSLHRTRGFRRGRSRGCGIDSRPREDQPHCVPSTALWRDDEKLYPAGRQYRHDGRSRRSHQVHAGLHSGNSIQPGREVSHIRRRWHRSRVVGRASSGRLCTRRFGRFCAGRT